MKKEPQIEKIIACLDSYLEHSGEEYIGPPAAKELLKKAKLLPNSESKPGRSLRESLRAGEIPHAYQVKGKYSRWRIPHSKGASGK